MTNIDPHKTLSRSWMQTADITMALGDNTGHSHQHVPFPEASKFEVITKDAASGADHLHLHGSLILSQSGAAVWATNTNKASGSFHYLPEPG